MARENPLQSYYDTIDPCRQHDIPMCADACPFRLDVLDLQSKVSTGRYNAAYKTLLHDTLFPGIVARVCPAYCQKACIRQVVDTPVQLLGLEKTILSLATRKEPNSYNMPARQGRIAVIGAGLSGLGLTHRLASKKYDVTVYDQADRIGGSLGEVMSEEEYLEEFGLQFKHEKYTLCLNREIRDPEELTGEGYDCIVVATGRQGNRFGIPLPESSSPGGEDSEGATSDPSASGGCRMLGNTALFLIGQAAGFDRMHGLANGMAVALAVENYLQTGALVWPGLPAPSRAVADENLLEDIPVPDAAEDGTFSDEDARAEAGRCIRCQCSACQSYCDILAYFKKWPLKMRDEVYNSVKPAGSLVHKAPARGYINTCTQCGLFSEICPEGIDLCEMLRVARREMHKAGKNPGGYRQYWLRDMAFANGPGAALTRPAPSSQYPVSEAPQYGGAACRYAYFPGCQLGALDPEYVIRSYRWLTKHLPDTGMLLRCCTVPADWDGNEELHREEIAALRREWESLGSPVLIVACMSCRRHLKEFLPEAETVTIYEIMSREAPDCAGSPLSCAVFDPCSARGDTRVQEAVRDLAIRAGLDISDLPEGDLHGCCGYGGDGSGATPDFRDYVAGRRASLSDLPYLVYCSNCRDVFADNGKAAIHIFDVLFDIDPEGTRPQPGVSQRRDNRVLLKEKLLEEFWGEAMMEKPTELQYLLQYDESAAEKAEKQRILDEDIDHVIAKAEETGRRTRNPESGHYRAYREIGHITFWVEYSCPEGAESRLRQIHNLYTHRMHIELEAVFNGRKIAEE